MAWIYLISAGLMEIGWPLGLKLAQHPGWRWQGIALAVIFMGVSGFLLFLAQKTIPMGTPYAVCGRISRQEFGVLILNGCKFP